MISAKALNHPGVVVVLSLLLCLCQTASAEDPVRFADVSLKAAVEKALGKTNPTRTDMLALTQFYPNNANISSLSGLEYAANLRELSIGDNYIRDISPLAGLINLTTLYLGGNEVSDLSPLSGLANLTTLVLWFNRISDISPLAGLINLTRLELEGNQISDLSPLAQLATLTYLTLYDNQIGDISALSGLTELTDLEIGTCIESKCIGNEVSDISALTGLTHLHILDLRSNPLNHRACRTCIPQILANNPGVMCEHDACTSQCTLTVSFTAGGSVASPGDGAFDYDPGTVVPAAATVNNGWHFLGWTGTAVTAGKVANPTSASTTVTMDDDYTLQATFEANQHTLTITCGPEGDVTIDVVSTNGSAQTLVGPGSYVLDHQTDVKVTVMPKADWTFTTWSGTMTSGQSVLAFKLIRDERLEANFAIHPQTLIVSCGEGGTIITPGAGSFAFEQGAIISVEAAPSAGYRFVGWTGTVVDRRDIADPSVSTTNVVVNAGGTLHANFEALRTFYESWETAAGDIYVPAKAAYIHADEGAWSLEDELSVSGSCGRTPQRGEVLNLDSGQALRLTSIDSNSTCSDVVSVSLVEAGLMNPGFAVPIDANAVISFYEVGQLDRPGMHAADANCTVPPCFDNASLLLTDNKGNVLAYVLQRQPQAVANVPNTNFRDSYREVFLDPTGIYYQRNLLSDLKTIPAFDPTGAKIQSIEFRVDEHGSAIIDELMISPGAVSSTVPVYRFWSPTLESHFFTSSADEKQTMIDLFPSVWTLEGIACFTPGNNSDPCTAPVYRFWSPTLSSHFYTISEEEKDMLLRDWPNVWTLDGIAFYAFPEGRQPVGACPVYRFWSGVLNRHFYTASAKEKDNLVNNFPDIWTLEGVAWYAYMAPWDSGRALGIVRVSSASN